MDTRRCALYSLSSIFSYSSAGPSSRFLTRVAPYVLLRDVVAPAASPATYRGPLESTQRAPLPPPLKASKPNVPLRSAIEVSPGASMIALRSFAILLGSQSPVRPPEEDLESAIQVLSQAEVLYLSTGDQRRSPREGRRSQVPQRSTTSLPQDEVLPPSRSCLQPKYIPILPSPTQHTSRPDALSSERSFLYTATPKSPVKKYHLQALHCESNFQCSMPGSPGSASQDCPRTTLRKTSPDQRTARRDLCRRSVPTRSTLPFSPCATSFGNAHRAPEHAHHDAKLDKEWRSNSVIASACDAAFGYAGLRD